MGSFFPLLSPFFITSTFSGILFIKFIHSPFLPAAAGAFTWKLDENKSVFSEVFLRRGKKRNENCFRALHKLSRDMSTKFAHTTVYNITLGFFSFILLVHVPLLSRHAKWAALIFSSCSILLRFSVSSQ